jgi:hypothetical protein
MTATLLMMVLFLKSVVVKIPVAPVVELVET